MAETVKIQVQCDVCKRLGFLPEWKCIRMTDQFGKQPRLVDLCPRCHRRYMAPLDAVARTERHQPQVARKQLVHVEGMTANGKGPGHRGVWGQFNEHGYRIGSDVAIITDILLKGAVDRQAINDVVYEEIYPLTRGGHPKNVPSLVSTQVTKMVERGYVVDSRFRLIAPPSK